MVDGLIGRWKGTARWPETDATVVSYEVLSDGRYDDGPPTAKVTFFYRDATKSLQSGELTIDSLTSLFNLRANDTFQIRFDPRNPSKFYCAEAGSWFTKFRVLFWIGVALFTMILAVILLFTHRWD